MLISRAKSGRTFPYFRLVTGTCLLFLFVAISLAEYRLPARINLSKPELSPGSTSAASAISDPKQILNQAVFDAELGRLDALIRAKDLLGLSAAADSIENTWGKTGGQFYGRLMLEVSNSLANFFEGRKRDELSQRYASVALAKADTLSLRLEIILLEFLARDLAPSPDAWVKERSDKTRLWLHAWRRLENSINRNFDFNDRPRLKVLPPQETGLPAGAVPEAIKDQNFRATYKTALAANSAKIREYNQQMELKQIDEIFPKKAEEYLVRVYTQPPYNLDELRRYLIAYDLDESIKKRALDKVAKIISEMQDKE